MLTWALRRGFLAHDRKDVAVTLLVYEPDVEITLSGAAGLGLEERYSGREAWYDFTDDLYESFTDLRYEVKRILDGGDRIVFEFDFLAAGKISEIEVKLSVGTVMQFSPRGKVQRQELFWQDGWKLALEAAGFGS